MKRINTVLAIILFVAAGCGKSKQSTREFITIDVTKSYPKKELILQDFMDVEYIPLETSDDFLTQGLVLAIGKDIIVVKNRINDGDIFIFDKTTGKGLKKINHKGQGPEEYTNASWITLDEEMGKMFVNDLLSEKILAYNLDGHFKRSFKHKEGALFVHVYNFDRENLLCYDGYFDYNDKGNRHLLSLISKQDGSLTKEIRIPAEEKVLTALMQKDGEMIYGGVPETHYPIIPHVDGWILVEPSSDTIYRYLPNHEMTPLIARTPSIQSWIRKYFSFLAFFPNAIILWRQ